MISFLLSFLVATVSPQAVTLNVTTSASGKGEICVAVFASKEDFVAKRSIMDIIRPTETGQTRLKIELPGAGHYVFAAFQDLNGNGELDTNFLGVPTEPYGFSETPPSKWRAPDFGEIATEVPAGRGTTASIALKLWKEQ
ncbi:DUF2141 domain-containing protein [Neolewinella antarctica]|uniref:Uncharacterized protein (DUF2141 family) n=1 Tax=Neolewinella antarctica TaxID=442734 RepID=A0ABX0XE11_9BACT|nr:DUF2141 domain-containing protein [Neolewinella antarctica]NJC27134.1 uncharacterized protein (DUF2141 family) [Neolewinella antarctica]